MAFPWRYAAATSKDLILQPLRIIVANTNFIPSGVLVGDSHPSLNCSEKPLATKRAFHVFPSSFSFSVTTHLVLINFFLSSHSTSEYTSFSLQLLNSFIFATFTCSQSLSGSP